MDAELKKMAAQLHGKSHLSLFGAGGPSACGTAAGLARRVSTVVPARRYPPPPLITSTGCVRPIVTKRLT
ncbi:hypothetical protein CRUP_031789 [Coryphaenoides rupestris]|nr:hypothetical protein CRUP_031789 [Coryphaenoides rupestris]